MLVGMLVEVQPQVVCSVRTWSAHINIGTGRCSLGGWKGDVGSLVREGIDVEGPNEGAERTLLAPLQMPPGVTRPFLKVS